MEPALIVHAGAGAYPPHYIGPAQKGCREAILAGWRVLQNKGSALDCVEAAVRVLEDNPLYNAGTGSSLTSEGKIEMDAGIMDGATLQVGAVAGIELIRNPIGVARKVLESPHVMLIGQGAQQFALEHEIPLCTHEDLLTEQVYKRWQEQRTAEVQQKEWKHGTVGAVAIDHTGRLAAATSTGGLMNKYPGRVGDSPLVGCGYYADEYAAVSCTGYGEDFVRLLIARRAAEFVAQGYSAQRAGNEAMTLLATLTTGTGALIIVDAQGRVASAKVSQHMPYASIWGEMLEPEVGI
jgi:beta-aspartyl-peptidase (threonine type)